MTISTSHSDQVGVSPKDSDLPYMLHTAKAFNNETIIIFGGISKGGESSDTNSLNRRVISYYPDHAILSYRHKKD